MARWPSSVVLTDTPLPPGIRPGWQVDPAALVSDFDTASARLIRETGFRETPHGRIPECLFEIAGAWRGRTVAEAERAFLETIEDDLAFCTEQGKPPERPFSGTFVVRVEPDIDRALLLEAERAGVNLNELVNRLLARGADAMRAGRPGGRRSGAPEGRSRPECPPSPRHAVYTPRCGIAGAGSVNGHTNWSRARARRAAGPTHAGVYPCATSRE
jgi:predicted HicB family RNase H-like nuclease